MSPGLRQENKPVPDVECLKYHGSPEKPDIKIFVSHRIDLNSETINNPLYIPVRCGAVYDERQGITMLGDDTGDNISDKRDSFCELTVQYWAWKNVKADYYGLCHYRRYLSFAESDRPGEWQRLGYISNMTEPYLEICGLLDEETIRNKIKLYDMVIGHEWYVGDTHTFRGKGYHTVHEWWSKGWENFFMTKESLDLLMETLAVHYPAYQADAKAYLSGKYFLGFNCFILKSELFHRLCQFEFDILFDLEHKIKFSHPSAIQKRVFAYFAEILYSIWIFHEKRNQVRTLETQVLLFQDTSPYYPITPAFQDKSCNIVVVYPINNLLDQPELDISIHSLVENSSNKYTYDIIILAQKPEICASIWGQKNYALCIDKTVRLAVGRPNISIRIFDPKDVLGVLALHSWGEPVQTSKFYRAMLPWILEKFDRAVVLSSLSIVAWDISELFFAELDNNYMGATKDIFFQGYLNGYDLDHIPQTNMKKPINQVDFNVLIFDLAKIRSIKSIEIIHENLQNSSFSEVNYLNCEYEEHVLFLPYSWNYMPLRSRKEMQHWQFSEAGEAAKYDAVSYPQIITYRPESPPWNSLSYADRGIFWKYARETEVYEIFLQRLMAATHPRRSLPPPPYRSKARKLADKVLPKGSRRRNLAKKILPKDSRRWRFCKTVYYKIFKR